MNDRLIDPYSPIQSSEDADDAFSALLAAVHSNDADLSLRIAGGLMESTFTRDEQLPFAALAVGQVLMGSRRYDEAKPWLERATHGNPETAEQAYNELAELARWQGATGAEIDDSTSPVHRHLRVAKEALDRHDHATAVAEAVKVYEYDEATTSDKAAASLIAAEALRAQGHDDQAALYAGWARDHGDPDQQSEAAVLLERWQDLARADTAMDDGVTKREVRLVLEQAETAWSSADWATAEHLLLELRGSGQALDAAQSDKVHLFLGDSYRNQHRYAEALAEYEQIRVDEMGVVKNAIDDLRTMLEFGEQR